MTRTGASWRRLAYAWRRHGWRLLGPVLVHNLARGLDRLRGRANVPRVGELDRRLGIDTWRAESTALMRIEGANLMRGNCYQPVGEAAFRRVVARLGIDPAEHAFVDYGSGKGRALLLACELGFRRVVGVEYARELHEAALANMARARGALPGVERVECAWSDAAAFEPPGGKLVCFLYNPFDGTVLRALLDRLSASFAAEPRDILVAYLNPVHRDVADAHPALAPRHAEDDLAIYRVVAGPRA